MRWKINLSHLLPMTLDLNSSEANYNGELSINPFDLNLNINLDNYKISELFI